MIGDLPPGVYSWLAETLVDDFPTAGTSSARPREIEIFLELALPEGIIGTQDRKGPVCRSEIKNV
jgi:hypothetical protein